MLKEAFVAIILTAFFLVCILMAGWPNTEQHVTVRYDCSIAEISPDYPVAVKEACRKRSNK
jgi:glyoxylate utilization-related uncharacterized protein